MIVVYQPFSEDFHSQIVNLIKESGLVCNTKELPRYGVAIVSQDFGHVIGYAGGHGKYGTVAHIDILVVDSGTREKGIGTILINKVCHLLLEAGYTNFTAEVEASNDKAIHLYLKLGAELKMSFGLNIETQRVIDTTSSLTRYHERPK